MKALSGKIARLPYHVREQLNRRLRDGEPAAGLLPWLHSLPPVKKALAQYFAGKPITPQNLSNWRKTGFQRWFDNQIPLDLFKEDSHDSRVFSRAARGLADGAAAFAAHRLYRALHPNSAEKPSHDEFVKMTRSLTALLKAGHNQSRLKLEQRKVRQNDARILLARDIHHRDVVAIGLRLLGDERAKIIEAAPVDNSAKIELVGLHLFGDLWQPRPLSETPPSHPHPYSQPPKDGPLADGAAIASRSIQHNPAQSSNLANENSTSANPREPSNSLANLQKISPEEPSKIVSLSSLDQGELSRSSRGLSRQSVAAADDEALIKTESQTIPENENVIGPTAMPSASQLSTINSQLISDPDTSDIPPPQITPGQTTQQLIAQIEEYSALLNARKRAPSSCRSRGHEALIKTESQTILENETCHQSVTPSDTEPNPQPALPELLSEGGSAIRNPQSEVSQLSTHPTLIPQNPPLSDYERALLEGKSRLEALYAQFTPTPEEFARRKRANEELRRASAAVSQLSTHPTLNYQQYGPCPAPLAAPKPLGVGGSWQGHRPLDPWKVHTS